MTRRHWTPLALTATLAFGRVAAAQPAPPDRAAPRTTAPAAPGASGPMLPEVTDPMLEPVPPAQHVLTSWQQALTMVRSESTNLNIAAAQVEQASGQARAALAHALPTLTNQTTLTHYLLTGQGFIFGANGITPGQIPHPLTRIDGSVDLSVPVFAPQQWHDAGTAQDSVQAARLSRKDAERVVLGSLASAIVTVVTDERLADVSRVSLKTALATAELTKKEAALGAATAVDVLRTEQDVETARAQVVASDESLREARESLGLALGSSQAWGVTPNIQLDQLASDAKAICHPEPSIDQRTDVRAARAQVGIAKRNMHSIDWQYLPTLNFVSDLDYTSVDRSSPDGKALSWSIGGVLSWTIYDGGVRGGTHSADEAALRIAQEQLKQTRRQAAIQVTQAERAVTVAEANLAVSHRSRDLAKEDQRLARIAFINGTGTNFDLVDAEQRLRQAELDLAVKQFAVVQAKIAALLALSTCDV
jgi:outer membrane protein, multidrug efflux system